MRFLTWLMGDHGIVPSPVKSYEWQFKDGGLLKKEHRFVNLRTLQIEAEIVEWGSEDGVFQVFKNGAGYGRYLSLDAAKKEAEKLVL